MEPYREAVERVLVTGICAWCRGRLTFFEDDTQVACAACGANVATSFARRLDGERAATPIAKSVAKPPTSDAPAAKRRSPALLVLATVVVGLRGILIYPENLVIGTLCLAVAAFGIIALAARVK